jgi:hypothetical protein
MRLGLSVTGMVMFALAALLASVLAALGFALSGPYDMSEQLEDPRRVASAIGRLAGDHLSILRFLTWCLLTSAVVTTIAGLARRRAWVGTGLATTTLLAVVLSVGTAHAHSALDAAMVRADRTLTDAAALEPPPAPIPPPTPDPPPPPPSVAETADGVRDMIAKTFDASVGPDKDDRGVTLAADDTELVATRCDGELVSPGVVLRFQTNDNRSSLVHILSAWDAAGYQPDRAIQADLRYSDQLPIERMEIRDRTTTDGMLHLVIQGRCSSP